MGVAATGGVSIDDVRAARLEPLGSWPPGVPAVSGSPQASALELTSDGRVSTGIWECTPGRFPSQRDGFCELMHFVSGEGTITDQDGTQHRIGPGAVLFVPDGWRGSWEIRATVRKTYTTVATAPAGAETV